MAPGTGPLASAGIHVSADDYYAAENWDVAKYWQRQAQAWGAPPPRGNVHVGGLVPLDPGSAGPEPPSRSEEHTSELQYIRRISDAVLGLIKKKKSKVTS